MVNNNRLIALMGGIAVGLLVLIIGIMIIDRPGKNKFSEDKESVFSHFSIRAFSVLFPDKTPEEVAADMGIKVEEYFKNCRVVKTPPDLLGLVMNVVYGISICFICFILGMTVAFYFVLIGLFALIYIGYYPRTKLKNQANKYRAEIANDLPGFLGLLKTELAIGLPIETAIGLIAGKQDTRLAKEFQLVARKAELGSTGWAEALEQMAADYDIETLKTFSMSVSSAYAKGVSISDTIERTADDIRATHLLQVKEDAARMTNYVIVPIVFFQLAPIIAFMLVPVLFAMQSMSF